MIHLQGTSFVVKKKVLCLESTDNKVLFTTDTYFRKFSLLYKSLISLGLDTNIRIF